MKNSPYIIVLLFFCLPSLFSQDLENIKEAKPVDFTGSISSQYGLYQASGIAPRNSTAYWNLRANASLNLWNTIKLPFSFTLGRSGSRVNYPTFAQFGLSPTYKWATVHLGYRNLNFSSYTLAGHTFLGVAIELKPGLLRFSAMKGRLRNVAEVDTTRSFVEPAFKRTAYAFKLGVGDEKTYFDFIFFKGKDDANSLENVGEINITPSENLVLGLKSKMTIAKGLWIDFDIAGSAFTRDQNSFADTTKKEGALNKIPNGLFAAKFSSRFNMAGKLGLTFSKKGNKVSIFAERIDPEYETMGAYFFANDIERFTVSPSFQLFKNKISLGGSYGLQRNNVLGNRLETTTRNIGSGVLDIHTNPNFGINLNYSNYSIYQESGTVSLDDTLAFNLSTTTISIMPRYTIQGENVMQNWTFMFNYQLSNQDNKAFFEQSQQFESILLSLNHNLVFLNSQFSLHSGLNYNSFAVANTETMLYGGTLGLSTPFKDNKMLLNFSASYNKRLLNKSNNGATLSSYLTYSFQPLPVHRFTLNFGFFKSIGALDNEFSEIRASVGYAYTFMRVKVTK